MDELSSFDMFRIQNDKIFEERKETDMKHFVVAALDKGIKKHNASSSRRGIYGVYRDL